MIPHAPFPATPDRASPLASPPALDDARQTFPHEYPLRCHDHPRLLSIHTMGRFHVRLPAAAGGREPIWADAQSRTALKCLVAAPHHQLTVDALIERLWADQELDLDTGRAQWRSTLSKLRRALEPQGRGYNRVSYLASEGQSVRLVVHQPDAEGLGVWLDSYRFEQLAQAALAALARGQDAQRLAEEALALYHGPFLPQDCYDDWCRGARDRYQRLHDTLVRRLAVQAMRMRRFDEALLLLGRRTDDSPDDEEAVRLSMIALVGAWRRREAERLYQRLRVRLWESAEREPGPELPALYAAIRVGTSVEDLLAGLP